MAHNSFDERHGPKLGRQIGAGRTWLQRLSEAADESESPEADLSSSSGVAPPWLAEGIGRAMWYRRRRRERLAEEVKARLGGKGLK